MLKRIFIVFLAICILITISSTKAAYDTSDLKNPHSQIFYLHSKTVNLNIEEQIHQALLEGRNPAEVFKQFVVAQPRALAFARAGDNRTYHNYHKTV